MYIYLHIDVAMCLLSIVEILRITLLIIEKCNRRQFDSCKIIIIPNVAYVALFLCQIFFLFSCTMLYGVVIYGIIVVYKESSP